MATLFRPKMSDLGIPRGCRLQTGRSVRDRCVACHRAKFHADRCHRRRDICNRTEKQELSYRKQIARQLRTQFLEGISVTLKSTLRVTQGVKVTGNGTIGQIIHDLLLDELLDVEYYRDLEM